MKPGRELDVLIAQKVFGFKTYKSSNPFDYSGEDKNIYNMSQLDEIGHVEETKQYSTDIAAAWEVVHIVGTRKQSFTLYGYFSEGFVCNFSSRDEDESAVYAEGETAPHAICLAALESVK